MASRFGIYDPQEVIVSVGGADIEGYFTGAFVQITYDNDAFNSVVGASGDVTRSKTDSLMATITLTLMQTSPSNDLLSTILNADLKGRNGAGVFALVIRDSASGRTVYTAANAWISKGPDASFDQQDSGRAWTLKAARLESFVGGA